MVNGLYFRGDKFKDHSSELELSQFSPRAAHGRGEQFSPRATLSREQLLADPEVIPLKPLDREDSSDALKKNALGKNGTNFSSYSFWFFVLALVMILGSSFLVLPSEFLLLNSFDSQDENQDLNTSIAEKIKAGIAAELADRKSNVDYEIERLRGELMTLSRDLESRTNQNQNNSGNDRQADHIWDKLAEIERGISDTKAERNLDVLLTKANWLAPSFGTRVEVFGSPKIGSKVSWWSYFQAGFVPSREKSSSTKKATAGDILAMDWNRIEPAKCVSMAPEGGGLLIKFPRRIVVDEIILGHLQIGDRLPGSFSAPRRATITTGIIPEARKDEIMTASSSLFDFIYYFGIHGMKALDVSTEDVTVWNSDFSSDLHWAEGTERISLPSSTAADVVRIRFSGNVDGAESTCIYRAAIYGDQTW